MQTPRLYRYFNYEQKLYIPAPTGGINTDAHPWELPENQAPVLDNFLIQPGKVVMRNPFYMLGTLPNINSTGNQCPGGAVLVNNTAAPEGLMIVSARSDNDPTKYIDPWNAPLVGAASAKLAASSIKIGQFNLTNGTSTLSSILSTQDQAPGPRWINFDGLIYGISYDSSNTVLTDTNGNYHMKPVSLYTLPATQTAGSVTLPTALANAPHGAFDLKGYQSRIWLLGGVDTPGGGFTIHEPTTLFFTNPGVSGVGASVNDWKDPVAGTTNKIRMDNNTEDYGVGLALVRNGMLIFRRSSVWILRGSSTSSYSLAPVSQEVGCLDARSIVESDHGVYFMSRRGLMLTNGTSIVNVSTNVSRQLTSELQFEQNNVQSGNSGWISCAITTQGQIMVSIGIIVVQGGTTFRMEPRWSGMYDPALRVWTRHTSLIWALESSYSAQPPLFVNGSAKGQLFTVGDNSVVELENFSRTTPVVGTQSPTFLNRNNFTTENVFFDYTSNTRADAIPAYWRTHFIPVNVGSRKMSIPQRYFMDALFAFSGTGTGAGSMTSGWRSAPTGIGQLGQAAAVAIQSPQRWPLASLLTDDIGRESRTDPMIQRHNSDWNNEIEDCYFVVDWPSTVMFGQYVTGGFAEVYGIGLEFQNTAPVR